MKLILGILLLLFIFGCAEEEVPDWDKICSRECAEFGWERYKVDSILSYASTQYECYCLNNGEPSSIGMIGSSRYYGGTEVY